MSVKVHCDNCKAISPANDMLVGPIPNQWGSLSFVQETKEAKNLRSNIREFKKKAPEEAVDLVASGIRAAVQQYETVFLHLCPTCLDLVLDGLNGLDRDEE